MGIDGGWGGALHTSSSCGSSTSCQTGPLPSSSSGVDGGCATSAGVMGVGAGARGGRGVAPPAPPPPPPLLPPLPAFGASEEDTVVRLNMRSTSTQSQHRRSSSYIRLQLTRDRLR